MLFKCPRIRNVTRNGYCLDQTFMIQVCALPYIYIYIYIYIYMYIYIYIYIPYGKNDGNKKCMDGENGMTFSF